MLYKYKYLFENLVWTRMIITFIFLDSLPLPYIFVSLFIHMISIFGVHCTYVGSNTMCCICTGLTIDQCICRCAKWYIAHCGGIVLAVASCVKVRFHLDSCTFLRWRIIHRNSELQVIGDQSFPDRTLTQIFQERSLPAWFQCTEDLRKGGIIRWVISQTHKATRDQIWRKIRRTR